MNVVVVVMVYDRYSCESVPEIARINLVYHTNIFNYSKLLNKWQRRNTNRVYSLTIFKLIQPKSLERAKKQMNTNHFYSLTIYIPILFESLSTSPELNHQPMQN